MPTPALDLTKQTFGRLTAIAPVGRDKWGNIVWSCRCTCGGSINTRGGSLKNGITVSCGCAKAEAASVSITERNTTHGLSKTPEYAAWKQMIQRCHNPNYPNFRYYGGRGISVCRKWRDSFEAFLAHIGPRPSPKHSVDRYPNNDGDYRPSNVRWATQHQQAANRRPPGLALWREARCPAY